MQALPTNYNFKNLTGEKFERLNVVAYAGKRDGRTAWWDCICDCGNKTTVRSYHLVSGRVQSCGCIWNEKMSQIKTTHGMRRTRIYGIWNQMIQRCTNPKHNRFLHYGGRGIDVSDEWRKFERFFHDMKESYEDHCKRNGVRRTSIDRIDNNKGYSKENCRWANPFEQARNRRPRHAGAKVNQHK